MRNNFAQHDIVVYAYICEKGRKCRGPARQYSFPAVRVREFAQGCPRRHAVLRRCAPPHWLARHTVHAIAGLETGAGDFSEGTGRIARNRQHDSVQNVGSLAAEKLAPRPERNGSSRGPSRSYACRRTGIQARTPSLAVGADQTATGVGRSELESGDARCRARCGSHPEA